jgi:hypothetical protein
LIKYNRICPRHPRLIGIIGWPAAFEFSFFSGSTGISPLLLRSHHHCLRRIFYTARVVTWWEYHYLFCLSSPLSSALKIIYRLDFFAIFATPAAKVPAHPLIWLKLSAITKGMYPIIVLFSFQSSYEKNLLILFLLLKNLSISLIKKSSSHMYRKIFSAFGSPVYELFTYFLIVASASFKLLITQTCATPSILAISLIPSSQ